MKENSDIREKIAGARTQTEFRECVTTLKNKFLPYHKGESVFIDEKSDYNLSIPPWLCQPYIRMDPDAHIQMMSDKQRMAEDPQAKKKEYFDDDGNSISR